MRRLRFLLLGLLFLFTANSVHAQLLLGARIDSLIALMTAQDKIDQLRNDAFGTTPANTKLKIPGFNMCDGPHGVRNGKNTSFPVGMAMAATWDEDLLLKVGKAMGEEFWANGYNQQLGPCIDLARDPRAGRTAESAGEDPFLSGHVGAALNIGIQQTPVIATIKHFMVESKQSNRNTCNEIFTERLMQEHYGYNFRYSVQKSGVLSLMAAYNLINGVHCTENDTLLRVSLRERWGFPFYVVSDWDAIYDSKKAVDAGTDICMGSDKYKNDLPTLVSSGKLTTSSLNTAVTHVLKTKILSGMMDYYPTGDPTLANSPAHKQLALDCARKSVILLKNTNKILPLNKANITKIAVIGPDATRGNLNCWGSSEVFPPYQISINQGIINKVGSTKVSFLKGCDVNSTDQSGFTAAINLAKTCDYVIFAGGLDSIQEGEAYGIGNDRKSNSIDLPGQQQALINQLAAANPNIIVVIQSGGVCGLHTCINNIKGLLYAFYPGQEGGNAIADIIFGDINPSGRMPVTMPQGDSQLPIWNDDFTDDYGCGYRWFDQNKLVPEFAFGFGLSYTTFVYSNLQLSANNAPAGTPITVNVTVSNTGTVVGEEVVELYLTNQSSSIWMPKKELKGFKRVSLQPGESKIVSIQLIAEDFYFWDQTNHKYTIEPGDFTIAVGGSSDNLPLSSILTLTSSTDKPDLEVTQIFSMPRYPKEGQKVRFYAYVRNQGTGDAVLNANTTVSFLVNNVAVSQATALNSTIPAGGSALIEANSATWTAVTAGTYFVQATVDNTNAIAELIETNNSTGSKITVYGSGSTTITNNLALNKPVTVTSSESATYPASNLVDGNSSTRWASAFADPQTVVVDLQSKYDLNKITVIWEAAYASAYSISISPDSLTWTQVVNVTAGVAGTTNFTVTGTARYVRLIGTKRATAYGYSLYELQVFGSSSTSLLANAGGDKSVSNPINNIVLDGSTSVGTNLKYTWQQVAGPQKLKMLDSTVSKLNIIPPSDGVYTFQLTVSNGTASSSDVAVLTISNSTVSSQLISLDTGWNLVSINLHVIDSSIATLFKGLDLQEVKTMDSFWRKNQSDVLNSLKAFEPGKAYLVNMNLAGKLNLSGNLMTSILNLPTTAGWHLLGCPFKISTAISTQLNSSNCIEIKNFDGFWMPAGSTNSLLNFEPGKGYFIKK